MRNHWLISIILVFILLIVPLFPRTWSSVVGALGLIVFLGLLFAWMHRFVRRAAQGKLSKEVALGIFIIPAAGVAVILLAVITGFVVSIFSGVNAFQESVAAINPNDPVAQGSAPLLAIPSFFEGGIVGLTLLWYGLVGGCLSSVVGFLYAIIYPWLLTWAEKSDIQKHPLSGSDSSQMGS